MGNAVLTQYRNAARFRFAVAATDVCLSSTPVCICQDCPETSLTKTLPAASLLDPGPLDENFEHRR